MANKNVWIMKSENCGIMGVYTTKKRAISAANCRLSQLADMQISGNFVQYEGKYHAELSSLDDYVTIEICGLNQVAIEG